MSAAIDTVGPYQPSAAGGLELRVDAARVALAWAHCGRTADLLALHLSALLGEEAPQVSHDIAYVANELIENAWKFNDGGEIRVTAALDGGAVLLHVRNAARPEHLATLKANVQALQGRDPAELLVERIEENAASGTGRSGLGFITLMSDYGAALGWRFEDGQVEVSARFVAG